MRPRTGAELKAVIDAERIGVPFLSFCDEADRLIVRALDDDPPLLTIGRHDGCELALAWDPRVSSTHAVLERLGQTWTISDDGISRNGTFVNEMRISSRRRLSDHDTIRVGASVITYRGATESTLTATALDGDGVAIALTPMQHKVLIALCRPLKEDAFAAPASNAQIAAELVLSIEAVKTHLRGLFARYDVADLPQNHKRAKVAQLAFQMGTISERDL